MFTIYLRKLKIVPELYGNKWSLNLETVCHNIKHKCLHPTMFLLKFPDVTRLFVAFYNRSLFEYMFVSFTSGNIYE